MIRKFGWQILVIIVIIILVILLIYSRDNTADNTVNTTNSIGGPPNYPVQNIGSDIAPSCPNLEVYYQNNTPYPTPGSLLIHVLSRQLSISADGKTTTNNAPSADEYNRLVDLVAQAHPWKMENSYNGWGNTMETDSGTVTLTFACSKSSVKNIKISGDQHPSSLDDIIGYLLELKEKYQ